ncbi:hypothetical protein ABI59_01390 [Acidobacteria bacterium Mor1]|nr:hypothetical protein ABI59_01390 [Acidobacteria bacterium Mor1]
MPEQARPLASRYAAADPFPHIAVDDFLPEGVARMLHDAFPDPESIAWQADATGPQAGKLGTRDARNMAGASPFVQHMLMVFNSSPFVRYLETLTGIDGLIPDPHFHGGGLHQIPRGGRLSIHADFSRHKSLGLERRVNALLYLNPGWDAAWGGQLELWDREMTRCVERIDPWFNRLAVFSTTATSYHGHPDPLACPEGITRKSMAFYYYTQSRPGEDAPHGTLWQRRPGTEDPVAAAPAAPRGSGLRRLASRWVPPAIADRLRGRR